MNENLEENKIYLHVLEPKQIVINTYIMLIKKQDPILKGQKIQTCRSRNQDA